MYRIDSERYKSLTNLVRKNEEALGSIRSGSAIAKLHSGADSLARHIESGSREATPLPIAIMAERRKSRPDPVEEEGLDEDENDRTEPELNEVIHDERCKTG